MSDAVVKPYKIERTCVPAPDLEQLVLKKVDNKESVFTRMLVKLRNAGLPTSQYGSEVFLPGTLGENSYPWDLFLTLKYRQDWRPSGYGLGDLVYAVSLLPNEELTLEVKTWETSKTQQDMTDATESRNVSDIKNTQSSAAETTDEEQKKEKTYVDGKAGYSGFGFSCSVAAGWSEDVATLNRDVSKRSQQDSQQATNEYKASRQVKMAISRESGSESKTTRKLKNINQFHALNVNYFQLLQEFTVGLQLYDVTMVILGKAPYLDVPFYPLGLAAQQTTIQEMIRASKSAKDVDAFTTKFGISPILVLQQLWTQVLWEGALATRDPIQYPAKEEDRNAFRNRMLEFVRPGPGWVEPDNSGRLRWAYEIRSGKERDCLMYLYSFVPYDAPQAIAVLGNFGMAAEEAYRLVMARKPAETIRLDAPARPQRIDRILSVGPFQNLTVQAFLESKLPEWVDNILQQFTGARQNIGPVPFEGEAAWKTTLPTQAVYADLSLGICSGGEDYYEVQRQFDLELKHAELAKLRMEVEKLTLENQLLQQGKTPSVVIKNPTANTRINLDVAVPQSGAEIGIETKE
jgi:hypothetical protein